MFCIHKSLLVCVWLALPLHSKSHSRRHHIVVVAVNIVTIAAVVVAAAAVFMAILSSNEHPDYVPILLPVLLLEIVKLPSMVITYDIALLLHLAAIRPSQNPACKDVADLFKRSKELGLQKTKGDTRTEKDNTAGTTPGKTTNPATTATAAAARSEDGCPMDKGELGAATWGLVSACVPVHRATSNTKACVCYRAECVSCVSHSRNVGAPEVVFSPPERFFHRNRYNEQQHQA